jgi:hypothetical protein
MLLKVAFDTTTLAPLEMLEHSADGNLFSVKGNPIIGEYDIYAQEGLELWCQTPL